MGTFKSLVEALFADAGVSKFRKALRSLLSFASPRSVKSARAINREAINSRAASAVKRSFPLAKIVSAERTSFAEKSQVPGTCGLLGTYPAVSL